LKPYSRPKNTHFFTIPTISSILTGSYSRRIVHFLENNISAHLEMKVANEVVLSFNTRLHAGDLLSALRIYFPTKGHQWAVHFLGVIDFLL
jgi:hypothetical protein